MASHGTKTPAPQIPAVCTCTSSPQPTVGCSTKTVSRWSILWPDHTVTQGHQWTMACGAKEDNSVSGQRWAELGREISWLTNWLTSNSLSFTWSNSCTTYYQRYLCQDTCSCQHNQTDHHQITVRYSIQSLIRFLYSLLSKTMRDPRCQTSFSVD